DPSLPTTAIRGASCSPMRSAQFLEEADHLEPADEEADGDERGKGIGPIPLRGCQRVETEIEARKPGQEDRRCEEEQLVLFAPDHALPPEGVFRLHPARQTGEKRRNVLRPFGMCGA